MKIKIVGLTFDVVEVECIEHGSAEIGRIDHLNQKIYIKKGLSKERKKSCYYMKPFIVYWNNLALRVNTTMRN